MMPKDGRQEHSEERVWVGIDRTINLGDYSSVKLMAGASETRDPKRRLEDQLHDLFDEVEQVIEERKKDYK